YRGRARAAGRVEFAEVLLALSWFVIYPAWRLNVAAPSARRNSVPNDLSGSDILFHKGGFRAMVMVSRDFSTGKPAIPKMRKAHRTAACWNSGERPGSARRVVGNSRDSQRDFSTTSPQSSERAFIPSGKIRQQSIGYS